MFAMDDQKFPQLKKTKPGLGSRIPASLKMGDQLYGEEPLYDTAGHPFKAEPWFIGVVRDKNVTHSRLLERGEIGDFVIRSFIPLFLDSSAVYIL